MSNTHGDARRSIGIFFLGLVGAVLAAHWSFATAEEKPMPRFFEMRIYTTHPGKLDALHKRFREYTNRLFKKHGMELVGYWTPTDDEAKDKLVYILAYPDREARERSWKAFRDDPEWQRVFQESHADGPIVRQFSNHPHNCVITCLCHNACGKMIGWSACDDRL
jgi:hypothetical protein